VPSATFKTDKDRASLPILRNSKDGLVTSFYLYKGTQNRWPTGRKKPIAEDEQSAFLHYTLHHVMRNIWDRTLLSIQLSIGPLLDILLARVKILPDKTYLFTDFTEVSQSVSSRSGIQPGVGEDMLGVSKIRRKKVYKTSSVISLTG
jgi:hypothetical protein